MRSEYQLRRTASSFNERFLQGGDIHCAARSSLSTITGDYCRGGELINSLEGYIDSAGQRQVPGRNQFISFQEYLMVNKP